MVTYKKIALLISSMSIAGLSYAATAAASSDNLIVAENSKVVAVTTKAHDWRKTNEIRHIHKRSRAGRKDNELKVGVHNWSTTGKERKHKRKRSTVSATSQTTGVASQIKLDEFAKNNNMTDKSYGEVCGAFMQENGGGDAAQNKRGHHRWGKSESHWTKKSFKQFKAREVTGGEEALIKSAGHIFGKSRKKHNCITTKVGIISDEAVQLESLKRK